MVDNRRIAKNAIALYVRMLFSVIVSLYTSRVVMAALGVDDYGVYGVVGSVVAMSTFLTNSMGAATSRFITYELGADNINRLRLTVSTAIVNHAIFSLVIVVLLESVGLWFLNFKLNFPSDSVAAAHWVYQLSILSAVINVMCAPFSALVVAHERLTVLAYIEIASVTLKLIAVFTLLAVPGTKLVIWATLNLVVGAIIFACYVIYCRRNFKESKFHWVWDKKLLGQMLSFGGWNLYGSGCYSFAQQGVNLLLNMFFGVVLNAANGIATVVGGTLQGFAYNVILAFRPQIVKQYAQRDIAAMQLIMNDALKYTLLLFSVVAVPLFFEMDYILGLWLTTVPPYAPIFCRLLILSIPFSLAAIIFNTAVQATGDIKWVSFISGTLLMSSIPISYVIYKCGGAPEWSYIITIVCFAAYMSSNLLIAKAKVDGLNIIHLVICFVKTSAIVAIAAIPCLLIFKHLSQSLVSSVVVALTYLVVCGVLTWVFLLNIQQRQVVSAKIHATLKIPHAGR